MKKSYFITLTSLLYRSTEDFPNEALLQLKIRSLANEILAGLILIDLKNPQALEQEKQKFSSQVSQNIKDLDEYLALARSKDLLERDNFLFIRQEYIKVKDEVERLMGKSEAQEASGLPRTKDIKERKESSLKTRQKEILKILAQKQSAQVSDLQKFFPKICKRTLRRDLDNLLKQGLVVRIGQWNEVFYKLKT